MQHIAFDYGVQIKPAQFNSNVSKIALSLRELLKYGGPKVEEAIRSGIGPTLSKMAKPVLKEDNGKLQTAIDIIREKET